MLLECNNITYQYPTAESPLFKSLSCRLTTPGFHALFGPSGVGKSTIARMMAGEINGFSGGINTIDIKSILYSYNLERLPGWANVGDHIAKVTPPGREDIRTDLLQSFGLDARLNSRFARLSLGQKTRANLTRYLLQDFDLLIMDESLANVDEATREQIILKIKAGFPQKCFLYISHNVHEVSKFCKDILVLRSASKDPQIVTVTGLDYSAGQSTAPKDLEKTMLEIVHAS